MNIEHIVWEVIAVKAIVSKRVRASLNHIGQTNRMRTLLEVEGLKIHSSLPNATAHIKLTHCVELVK